MRFFNALLLMAVTLTLSSQYAHATKARVAALQGARFITDSQYIFQNPAQIHGLKNYLTYEFGAAGGNPSAEGGIFKDMMGGRGGIYLGHQSPIQSLYRNMAGGYLKEENPVEVFYGQGTWAASLGFSNSDKKTTGESQQSLTAKFGIDTEDTELWANIDVIGKAKMNNGDKFNGGPVIVVGGEKHLENNLYINGALHYGKMDNTVGGAKTKIDSLGAEVAVLDRSIKNEKAAIYYGPKLRWNEDKWDSKKVSVLDLPLYLGMEYVATTWLTARASVSQNIIIGSKKDETVAAPGDKADTIGNNTQVAVGLGMKWEGLAVDATFAGTTTGQFNGNTILANLGMIYTF